MSAKRFVAYPTGQKAIGPAGCQNIQLFELPEQEADCEYKARELAHLAAHKAGMTLHAVRVESAYRAVKHRQQAEVLAVI